MTEINYLGEHLLIGNLGHFAVVLAFAASILASLSYLKAANEIENGAWHKIARISFRLHSLAVLGIVAALFWIIQKHYFEYHYAWSHSSLDLPAHYMISCFWEGQEGSFLLWLFWHVVIGNVLLHTSGKWENPVMTIVSFAQVALSSMLLGITFFGYKVGSSPFVLMREVMANAPLFSQPDYLSKITDGKGLNPLLQNYWMVIHPPTLFFGFASTIVPFAFAIAGLWKGWYKEWIKPALPWALAAVMVLGTGIIMGGFWAYESLSFGGYWAWDPVENASLIPWLTLIAGVHCMMIFKSTGHSLITTLLLIIGTFLLILYATFLTRSGILGDSSVHAFTDLGMSGQLLIFLGAFVVISVWMLVKRWKALPVTKKEESTYSREFWMFIGALLLTLSAFQVFLTTSIPVFNKILIHPLFDKNLAKPIDDIAHYNSWQLPIAIIIALLAAVGQFFKYKSTPAAFFKRKAIPAALIALVVSVICFYLLNLKNWLYLGLLFSALFTIIANASVILKGISGKIQLAGASVAHIGFGCMLIGVLISSANKEVISYNNTGKDIFGGDDQKTTKENFENIVLMRNSPVMMGDYKVTYVGDSVSGINKYFKVDYHRTDSSSGRVLESFRLYPNAQNNPKMGFVPNPDTRHYLLKDVFTHVTYDPKSQKEVSEEPFSNVKKQEVAVGDTIITNNAKLIFEGVVSDSASIIDTSRHSIKMQVKAKFRIIMLDKTLFAYPEYAIVNNMQLSKPLVIDEAGLKIQFNRFVNVNPPLRIEIETGERKPGSEFIVMKAIVFPYINLLWSGTIIMIIGFLMAIIRRYREFISQQKRDAA
jgi:cytochrome c-type biogenesis protein CcmF